MSRNKGHGKSNGSMGVVVIIGIILIVIIAVIVVKSKKPEEEGGDTGEEIEEREPTVITGEKLTQVREYNGLEVSNVQFQLNGKTTLITADVKNNTGSDKEGQYVNVKVIDKKGKELTTIGGYIDPVKAGETVRFSSIILSNNEDDKAYDIEITPQEEGTTTVTE